MRKVFILGPAYEPMEPFGDDEYIASDIETAIQSLFEDVLVDVQDPQIISAQTATVTETLEGRPYLVAVTTIIVEWDQP